MLNLLRTRTHVDEPIPLRATEGGMSISGWSFDESTMSPLRVRLVIGDAAFECESGLERPDLTAVFPLWPQAARSGFFLRRWLPRGYATAHVEVSADGAGWHRVRSLPYCGEIAPLVGRIETPETTDLREDVIQISGWAFHPQEEIDELTVQFGGSSARCRCGMLRNDVANAFPGVLNTTRSGFAAQLHVIPGTDRLRLKAKLRSGASVTHTSATQLSVAANADTERLLQVLDEERSALLRLPMNEEPTVSIIIAVFNQLEVTLACLKSVSEHTSGVAYEVIIVNDASDERTRRSLERIEGLRLLTNGRNLGFLKSSNKGAGAARGEYLLFLNNDTEVTPRWLEGMLRVLETRRDAGLVGAKLVYPDGRLQEAGGIMWRDASGVNYGKWDDPAKPEYNYLREVDYCSGACILVRKADFDDLGGFDLRYAPAYYEDTDLAFALRAKGRKVYYQPLSVVIHHEGQTSGTSTESGVKSFQLVNQVKFVEKWRKALASHLPNDPANIPRARDRSAAKRLLVVDARMLSPDQDSGSLRMLNLLLVLQELGFQIVFVPLNLQHVSPYTEQLQDLGVECIYAPFFPGPEEFFRTRGSEFDAVMLSRREVASAVLSLCRKLIPTTPVIFDTVDLHFLREQREAEHEQNEEKRRHAAEMERLELKLISEADAATVVSPVEKKVIEEKLPGRDIAIVSNIHEIRPGPIAPYHARRDMLFIGGFEHTPNIDAMTWFAAEIMPLVVAAIPDAKLHIIGSKMPEAIRALGTRNILVHGYVPNVEPFLGSCLLSIAPLRWGAGVKGKINQSMSYGLPVVSTSLAAEGMFLVHETNVLIADDASGFAREIVRLHGDPALWERLSDNSCRNIERHFSIAAAKQNVHELFGRLAILPLKTARAGATRTVPLF